MANGQDVAKYFRRKGDQWTAISGSVESHLRKNGRQGMKAEFEGDPDFYIVCKYLKEVGEIQLRSDVAKSLEELVSATFGFVVVGAIDILIGAIVEACGDRPLGDQLLEGAGAVAVIGLIGLAIGALFSK